MVFKCVIIDDDQYAIDGLAGYIEQMPNLVVAKTFTTPIDALTSISHADAIDFIFLDIEMPEISGLELAKQLREMTRFLLFTTSHTKHALTAFDLNASQYLLKPISSPKFALAISYLLKSIENNPVSKKEQHGLQFIKADQKNTYHQIDPNEIIYIQAAKNYVIIFTDKEQFVTHTGLNHIESALPQNSFIRISKSYIIAKNAIKKIEGNSIRLKNSQVLQIGATYKPPFVDFIRENMVVPK